MITKLVIIITNQMKPILLKLFPYGFLRKIKGEMISKSFHKLKIMNIIPYEQGKYPFGVNLIGNIKAETGLGQSCRLVANMLNSANIPLLIYHYDQLGTIKDSDTTWDYKISKRIKFGINIIHINPHEMGLAFMQMNQEVWDYRYNIAFWLWELEDFPDEWKPCFNVIDEIWTPSEFISSSIRKKTRLPVRTIPYYVTVEIEKEYRRKDFGLPEDVFLFLMMYDSGSILERKNPLGVINAFKKAFSKNDKSVGLVIKISNSTNEDINKIFSILDGYTNVYLIREVLCKDQVNSLIKYVDVFVSLHRAEGFGLVLAEAMLLGTPTIATNWSSNTEFMNSEVACMVDASMIQIEKDLGPFKRGNWWADPDIEQASGYMRKLYEDEEYKINISKKAKKYIEGKLDKSTINNLIKELIYKENSL